jgi:hypothetical protein
MCARGTRANSTPAKIIGKLRGDAASAPLLFGFLEDPLRLLTGRYYGYLAYAPAYR